MLVRPPVEQGIGRRAVTPNSSKCPGWHEPYTERSDNIFGILTILSYLLERIAPHTCGHKVVATRAALGIIGKLRKTHRPSPKSSKTISKNNGGILGASSHAIEYRCNLLVFVVVCSGITAEYVQYIIVVARVRTATPPQHGFADDSRRMSR
jgi:hypothetical protein